MQDINYINILAKLMTLESCEYLQLVQLFARRWLYLSYNASQAVGTILAVSLYGCTLAFALPAEGTRKVGALSARCINEIGTRSLQ